MARRIARVATQDRELRQVQENILAVLEPVLAGGFPVYAASRRPVASADVVGQVVVVQASGSGDSLQVCLGTSAGGFEWVTVAAAP